jgi:hypothetical protein
MRFFKHSIASFILYIIDQKCPWRRCRDHCRRSDGGAAATAAAVAMAAVFFFK